MKREIMRVTHSMQRPYWLDYAELEMTVLPINHGMKRPKFKWNKFKWTKLHSLLNSDNGYTSLSKLYELGEGGLAVVCGRPSENLFVIDSDSKEVLESMRTMLALRGINAPCVFTARGGHLYLRSREGAVKTTKGDGFDVQGDGALVVLPPTRHKTGIIYRWEKDTTPRNIPTVSIDDIDFLTKNGLPLRLTTSKASKRRLHDDTRAYLQSGHMLPEGQRNDGLFNASRDYVYVGRSEAEALHDLLPIATASGLTDEEAVATILSPYKNTRTQKPSTSIDAKLRAFLASIKWTGRTGNTDSRVLEALIERRKLDAYNRADGEFRASQREIVLRTGGISRKTVGRSLKRLIERGFIQVTGMAKESRATLYRFSEMVLACGGVFLLQNDTIKTAGAVRSTYWGTYANIYKTIIGNTGLAILESLQNTVHSVTEIAQRIGKNYSTARYNLKKLITLGLVTESAKYRYTAPVLNLSEQYAIIAQTEAHNAFIALQECMEVEWAEYRLNPILKYLWTQNENKKEQQS